MLGLRRGLSGQQRIDRPAQVLARHRQVMAQRRQARRLVNNAITSFRKDTSTSSKTEA